jgi:hypothetical protein
MLAPISPYVDSSSQNRAGGVLPRVGPDDLDRLGPVEPLVLGDGERDVRAGQQVPEGDRFGVARAARSNHSPRTMSNSSSTATGC